MAVRHVHFPAVLKGHPHDSDLVLYGLYGPLHPTIGPTRSHWTRLHDEPAATQLLLAADQPR